MTFEDVYEDTIDYVYATFCEYIDNFGVHADKDRINGIFDEELGDYDVLYHLLYNVKIKYTDVVSYIADIQPDKCILRVNKYILKDEYEKYWRDIIIHELTHFICYYFMPNIYLHDNEYKNICKYVFKGELCDNQGPIAIVRDESNCKYVAVCPKCGRKYYYKIKPKWLKNKKKICEECGAEITELVVLE